MFRIFYLPEGWEWRHSSQRQAWQLGYFDRCGRFVPRWWVTDVFMRECAYPNIVIGQMCRWCERAWKINHDWVKNSDSGPWF